MGFEATTPADVDDPTTRFGARTRTRTRRRGRRQTQQWKNVFDAAQNGDLNAVRRYIEEQRVDVDSSLPGNTGSLLSAAAQEGHTDIVRYLISRGADVNAKDRYGYNALLWVLDKNKTTRLDVIQLLVESGADVNVQAKENGYTPLHWAVIHNRLDAVQYLVSMNADLSSRTKEGLTAVDEASKHRLSDIVVYLNNIANRFGATESGDIFDAAARGDLNAVRYFVESEHKDPFALGVSGETALHVAAAGGKLAVVKYLLEMKSRNVNIANASGESPLISATRGGHLTVMQYLIGDRHANPDAVDRIGYTPLLVAASLGNVEVVRFLINRGNANTKAMDRDFSNNVLHVAALYGQANVVAFLVDEKKFNIYAKNKYGDTALHVAARYGRLPIVKYFIDDKGMNYALANAMGRNVLHAAAEGGSLEVVKYLLDEKRADLMSKDSNQNTVLHTAVGSDQLELVKHLVEVRGLDATVPNGYGSSAVMLARTFSRQQILSYFVYERGLTLDSTTTTSSKPNVQLPLANPLTISNSVDAGSKNPQKPPVRKPANSVDAAIMKPIVRPEEQFFNGPKFNLQTTQEVIQEGDSVKIKQHYLINGKEVDKATMDKAIMDFMKASAAFNAPAGGNRVTWGLSTMTDPNGVTRTKYIVNGQEVSQEYYESVVKQYGSGNPNGVSTTFTSSSAGTQFAPQQYYNPGRRRRRSIVSSKTDSSKIDATITKAGPASLWPVPDSGQLSNGSGQGTGGTLSTAFGDSSDVHNFLILLNWAQGARGNRFQHRPKHGSLMSREEIIENRIDYDAINAVSGVYSF